MTPVMCPYCQAPAQLIGGASIYPRAVLRADLRPEVW